MEGVPVVSDVCHGNVKGAVAYGIGLHLVAYAIALVSIVIKESGAIIVQD